MHTQAYLHIHNAHVCTPTQKHKCTTRIHKHSHTCICPKPSSGPLSRTEDPRVAPPKADPQILIESPHICALMAPGAQTVLPWVRSQVGELRTRVCHPEVGGLLLQNPEERSLFLQLWAVHFSPCPAPPTLPPQGRRLFCSEAAGRPTATQSHRCRARLSPECWGLL